VLASVLSLVATVFLAVSIGIFAGRRTQYSQLHHTISELGELGGSDARRVAFGVFLPVGLLTFAAAVLVRAEAPAVAALGICLAVGYLSAVAFPCDPGSPLSGSYRQLAHNLGGAVQYVGGGASLLAMSSQGVAAYKLAGVTILGCALVLSAATRWRGVLQRVAEAVLFVCFVYATWKAGSGAA
jgi:hypothetical protein